MCCVCTLHVAASSMWCAGTRFCSHLGNSVTSVLPCRQGITQVIAEDSTVQNIAEFQVGGASGSLNVGGTVAPSSGGDQFLGERTSDPNPKKPFSTSAARLRPAAKVTAFRC